ncbi:lysosomal pro-X carboxypeptidase, putative [Ricinus communis]|uniref:Lysosomal pro-X carboxypeptidase, putative n=1 Tax=Ricinus communis TaxID=3988 RepID=B9SCN2_RICCO|nr:lysosomal pro-X carboxypeptidase, putative [Ricinus communis]
MALPSFQLCMVLVLLVPACASALHPRKLTRTTRFGGEKRFAASEFSYQLPSDYEIHYYTQTLDHFNYKPESYATFQQRYILNFKYWGGANTSSPIFLYTGAEENLIYHVDRSIVELAARFRGLLLYIEHRYYGESMPFGSEEQALQNSSTLGYLSSEQALADYAQVITDVKKNLSAENCPAIAVGASYGGMLAAWFRLKYPHIVIGSLASSSPILYFDDITPQNGYHVLSRRILDESCHNTIKQSWSEIDRVAAQPNGLLTLSNMFNTCRPLVSSAEFKEYLELLYITAAQYDNPPDNPVQSTCRGIDGAPPGTDILGRIVEGLNGRIPGWSSCHDIFTLELSNNGSWDWQTCTEMVFPIGYGDNETMFQPSPFDINNYKKECLQVFGIKPRPHWVTTEFGGHDIKTVLGNFASNIIFANGLRDPWSAGGVLEDISDSIVAVYTEHGAHCLDLYPSTPDDPNWLVEQREKEIKIIAAWLAEYYAKLFTK